MKWDNKIFQTNTFYTQSNEIVDTPMILGQKLRLMAWDFRPIMSGQPPRLVDCTCELGNLIDNPFAAIGSKAKVYEIYGSSVPGLSGAPYFNMAGKIVGLNLGGGTAPGSPNYMLPFDVHLKSLYLNTSQKNFQSPQ
jgi:hypothetical protein